MKLNQTVDFHLMENMYSISKDKEDLSFFKVPCTKSAIFNHQKLSFLEKRQLMKFLQFCMDLLKASTTTEKKANNIEKNQEVIWTNETSLNIGRSLKRPQNLDTSLTTDMLKELKESKLKPIEFLKSKFSLSDKLIGLVGFSIAFFENFSEFEKCPLEIFIQRIMKFVKSIGRYSLKNIFITPTYGMSELCEGFCRQAAVNGSIYVLRNRIVKIEETEICKIELQDGTVLKSKNFVFESLKGLEDVVRFVFLSQTSLFSDKSKSILIIPEDILDNSHIKSAIHVVELDGSLNVVPKEFFLLHVTVKLRLNTVESVLTLKKQLIALFSRLNNIWSFSWSAAFIFKPKDDLIVLAKDKESKVTCNEIKSSFAIDTDSFFC